MTGYALVNTTMRPDALKPNFSVFMMVRLGVPFWTALESSSPRTLFTTLPYLWTLLKRLQRLFVGTNAAND